MDRLANRTSTEGADHIISSILRGSPKQNDDLTVLICDLCGLISNVSINPPTILCSKARTLHTEPPKNAGRC